ncbi:CC0125/CC1285 family lipoprotein, partial [Klebsiella pneumoniae]|uniref:CC0125/CC1285 family lipoprotein n=1 Tax=Klebsiella pneumoniae TaxID=573 RepID=UPI001952EDC8
WDPFFDDPFWRDRDWDYRTVTQYEALAEVVMGKGPKPADNLRAFDAHEVVARLGPSIQMPKAN